MKTSNKGIALIQSFEGCRLQAYPDPGTGGDPWTIGWGATGPNIKKGTVWTQEQADKRLIDHLAIFEAHVNTLIKTTTQGQFDALVSFAYNCGPANLAKSTLLRMHNAGDYEGAAKQFARWNKAAGKVLRGLTRRRAAEAELYKGVA
jgi:lysozyme